MDSDIERRLDEIERQVRAARGEEIENTPWDYNIPTGRELKYLRERCQLSRFEVAERLDYSPATVQNIENGGQPPGRNFLQQALRLYKMEWPRGPEPVDPVGGGR